MKSVATRNSKRPASPMRILLIWTLVSALLFGVAEFGAHQSFFRIAGDQDQETTGRQMIEQGSQK